MSNIEKLVAEIAELTRGYVPMGGTAEVLQTKVVAPIVGPFGVGKSTLMRRVAEMNNDFSYVLGFTTRPRRPHEPDGVYRYIEHTEENLEAMREQLINGELVQAVVHPTTGFIYGSDLDSYNNDFNILDVFSTVIHEFESLPFKELVTTYLVAPLPDWLARIEERGDIHSADELEKRWEEARLNLEWGIQNEARINWAENANGQLDAAAEFVARVVRHEQASDPNGPELARIMLMEAERQLTVER